jgi:hypothetical protein
MWKIQVEKPEIKKVFVFVFGLKISISNQISLHPGGQSSYCITDILAVALMDPWIKQTPTAVCRRDPNFSDPNVFAIYLRKVSLIVSYATKGFQFFPEIFL